MSYSHAEKIAGHDRRPPAPIDPALLAAPKMLAALAARDITEVYRRLIDNGVSQHEIARRTGQSQSEVCAILQGRKVGMYDLLVRICEGLGVAREAMGLSYGQRGPYAEGVTVVGPKGVDGDMLRRHALALGGVAAFGAAVKGLGAQLAALGAPSPVSLPSRLDWHHVTQVRDLTRRFGEAGHGYVSDPGVCSAAAARAAQLLDVSGPESVQRTLLTAVAELHIEAGWAAFDATLYDQAMYHFARALELATEAGDHYCQATALSYAGLASVEHGHPNDGLTMLQLAQVKAWDISPDDHRAVVVGVSGRAAREACALEESATALARLGHPDTARTELGKARQLWRPTRSDPFGDLDRPAARLELDRGRLEVAEQHATASVRRWDGINQVGRTRSGIVLATVYVQAGEPRGLGMAKSAVDAVAQLNSPRTHRQLAPLVAALESRPGGDARELAVHARRVAAA